MSHLIVHRDDSITSHPEFFLYFGCGQATLYEALSIRRSVHDELKSAHF